MSSLPYKVWRMLSFGLSFILIGCASVGSPGGGPEDTTPPEIISIMPEPGSTNVAPDARIEIIFSEPIDESSLLSSLFISPPQNKLKVNVRGRKVTLKLSSGIPVDRAAIISFGSGIKDYHGNGLVKSTTMALTAGDRIEGGEITGRIYGDQSTVSMVVGAWPFTDTTLIRPDSIEAPFLTQTGESGIYSLEYLPIGVYRVLAWDDKDHNRLYQPGSDRLAVAWINVAANSDSASTMNLYATLRDTLTESLLMVSAQDNSHLQLRYSKRPSEAIISSIGDINVVDSFGGRLDLQSWWFNANDSSRISFRTSLQADTVNYSLTMSPNDSIKFDFRAMSNSDTLGPSLTRTFPPDNGRDVPRMASGMIAFDDDITGDSLLQSVSLTIKDSLSCPILVEKVTPNTLKWQVSTLLETAEKCLITIDLTKVHDWSGNVAGDTTTTRFFSVIDPGGLGEISGEIKSGRHISVIVSAKRVGASRVTPVEIRAKSGEEFRIENLVPGDYSLWCWEDRDNNGIYSPGAFDPFVHSESFEVLQDTVTVRARWETGGVKFNLR